MKYTLKHICLSADAPIQAGYAADELRYYISLMCARPCPIEADASHAAVTP